VSALGMRIRAMCNGARTWGAGRFLDLTASCPACCLRGLMSAWPGAVWLWLQVAASCKFGQSHLLSHARQQRAVRKPQICTVMATRHASTYPSCSK
jgi:hypothetical protein